MNPHHNQASTSAVQQVNNPVMNQQMFNGNVAGLFPNNMPIVAPPGFPNQPFPMQNGQLPNAIRGFAPQQNLIPFPVNQFNPSQQQQLQFFAQNSMNPTYRPNVALPNEQVLMQNTIQNIYQLLQLQNSSYAQSSPVFQNPMLNVINPGFPLNQQFVNGPVQHANNRPQNICQQLQGTMFLPGASGSVQTQQPQNLHATLTNFQIPQGMGPQNQNFFPSQMFGMANINGPTQNVSQGQPGFVPPMLDVNASRQIVNTGQTHNPSPTPTNFEDNHKSVPANANGGWTEGQHKNFTGPKTYDPSHKRSKSHKHVKFGNYKGNMNKEGGSNLEVDLVSRNPTNFEKKIPTLTYTEQEIKEWREARKKHYPTNETVLKQHKKGHALSDVTNQEAMLRRQQLKEILAKQAELGCEVAEVPASYLSSPGKQNPRDGRYERQPRFKRGKFNNKRRTSFQDDDWIAKRVRPRDQDSFKRNHQTKPKKPEQSLLQKLLTPDIKRDKAHLLQVLRFMTANLFFSGESLRFPSVIVRETTNADVPSKETTCSVMKIEEEGEKETCSVIKVEEEGEKETCSVIKVEEEEGEIID